MKCFYILQTTVCLQNKQKYVIIFNYQKGKKLNLQCAENSFFFSFLTFNHKIVCVKLKLEVFIICIPFSFSQNLL